MSEANFLDLQKYQKKKKIGKGGFGKVYIVKDKATNEIYAAKISIKKIDKKSPKSLMNIAREVNIISKLNHPSVLKFIGYSPIDFDKKSRPVIITEFSPNGSLRDILDLEREKKSINGWDETKKLILIYGVANGMAYLHSHNIVHRDLKPDNIFLDNYLCPKIADFGLSKINNNDSVSIDSLKSTKGEIKGTAIYIAPEIWTKQEYSSASDVYAFSLILYEIFTGEMPFKGYQYFQLYKAIGFDHKRPNFSKEIPKPFKELIESCWSQLPNDRPSFNTIIEQLKTDPKFIYDGVEKEDYLSYIYFIEKSKISFDSKKKVIHLSEMINPKSKSFNKVSISKNKVIKKQTDKIIEQEKIIETIESGKIKNDEIVKNLKFIDSQTFNTLDYSCKRFVLEAEDGNEESTFTVIRGFIEGLNDFPSVPEIGIKYLDDEILRQNIKAFEYYGKLLIQGDYVPKDEEKAIQILTNAVNNFNSSVAKLELAKVILSHESFDISNSNENINYVLAKQYSKEAADDGNMEAILLYARICLKEKKNKFGEIHNDKHESFKYLKIAAEYGDPTGIALYGEFFEDGGTVVKSDPNEAIKFYKMAYEKGDMYGYALLGNALCTSLGNLQKNEEEGKKLIQISFENNNIYGICYYSFHINDQQKKNEYYKMAADLGSGTALFNLGIFYKEGQGFEKNEELYVKYMKKAVEEGSLLAAFNLGLYYEKNVKDLETAKRYFKYASDHGSIKSISFYVNYILDEENREEINEYLNKGIDFGDTLCMIKYAELYLEGKIFPQNLSEAAKYTKMAADLGNKQAMILYSKYLRNGIGVEKNEEEARKYQIMGTDLSNTECLIQ